MSLPRTVAVVTLASLAMTTVAVAQPGAVEPQPYAPQPQPYGPQPDVPPPQAYAPDHIQVQLTEDERKLLWEGEIDTPKILVGGAAAVCFGFGVGQAVQGRWGDTGWIFTFGEIGALTMLIGGAISSIDNCNESSAQCGDGNNSNLAFMVAGSVGFVVLRIWESVDAFTGPASHNRRVRELQLRTGYQRPYYSRVMPYATSTATSGGTAGLTLRF